MTTHDQKIRMTRTLTAATIIAFIIQPLGVWTMAFAFTTIFIANIPSE